MSRYKYTKLRNLGPVDGFIIHTPDDRQLIDTHPQTIVRELNRLNVEIDEKRKDIVYLATEKAKLEERIKRLEEALTEIELAMKQPASNHRLMQVSGPARQVINIIKKAKEVKP